MWYQSFFADYRLTGNIESVMDVIKVMPFMDKINLGFYGFNR
jgi:hypothetical protein